MDSKINNINRPLQLTTHDFLIYKDSNDNVKVNVMLINNDIWLTQNLIAELFGVGRSTITEHINNILNGGELDEKNTVGKTDIDNSKKPVKIYNLDMIIAVGYRVNSKKATNFLGLYELRRYARVFEDIEPIVPIPVKRKLNIWNYDG